MAADPAERQRRITAPVEKEQCLLPCLQGFGYGHCQNRRKPFTPFRRLRTHVDRLNIGQCGAGKTGPQMHMGVTALHHVYMTFDRRRCRRQNNRMSGEMTAHDRHIARLVGDPVLLLEGGIVLFVNVVGSLAIGVAAARVARGSIAWAFIVTGVLGGFTTMSGLAVFSSSRLQTRSSTLSS